MQADTNPPETGNPTTAATYPSRLRETLEVLLAAIYPERDTGALTRDVLEAFHGDSARPRRRGRTPANTLCSERDGYLICYGNSRWRPKTRAVGWRACRPIFPRRC